MELALSGRSFCRSLISREDEYKGIARSSIKHSFSKEEFLEVLQTIE